MKILHLMLSNFYIDDAGYQENIIPRINMLDGHDVLIVASTETLEKNNSIIYTVKSEYENSDGIKVIRLDYRNIFNHFLSRKIRSYKGLYKIIKAFSPDIIFFHGASAWAINDVVKYKRHHPKIRFYLDSHEDFNNSARGFFSKNILHKLFYKNIIQSNLKYIDKILYITKETHTFLNKFYEIPNDKLYFYPLGGILPDEKERLRKRKLIRTKLGIGDNEILCIHSGKFNELKRTKEILKGFHLSKSQNIKLIIIGSGENDTIEFINDYTQRDNRISFLGWKNFDELQELLMAGDLYIQLGSQSATMQQAICNGCQIAVYPFESHLYLLKDKAYYISNDKGLTDLLNEISQNISEFEERRKSLLAFVQHLLDYNIIAKKIYDNKNLNI